MEKSLIIAGFGGQGVLLIGKILSYTANEMGKYATFFPSYGAEQRGGTANCTVITSDEEIGCPICGKYNDIIIMNELSYQRFKNSLRCKGRMIINSSAVVSRPENGIEYYTVDCDETAKQTGSEKAANMVMLGYYTALDEGYDTKIILDIIKHNFADKPKLIDINVKAFQAGKEAYKT